MFSDTIIQKAKDHARQEYPKESCGLVVNDEYIAVFNKHPDPENHFEIDMAVYREYAEEDIQAIVHSHPNGPLHPTKTDAEQQIATAKPWIIIPLDDTRVGDPIVFGDEVPMAPLIGRKFMHYVADCYTLVRDTYRLGKDALKEQDVTDEWPFDPIELDPFPRDDEWWKNADDLYNENYAKQGFVPVNQWEVLPGDIFLASINSDKYNHGGLLIAEGLLLHHLPHRLSRREPSGIWGRQAGLWIRYKGNSDA